jgi:lipopolysaccharide export system protein LptA
MPLQVYRLRRLLAATAVLLTVVVTAMYFYARWRTTDVLKKVPGKIGYDIKQIANGFQFSKSDGGRTLFTVQASDVKQFKLSGNAELHDVNIVLYGRDSSRYDQIYGDDFAFDQKSGNVTAKGEVQIDLVANPAGLASPDQSIPKELKNPIHLKTRDLVFNKDTGNAVTNARVEFRTPQATGWAVGVKYAGKSNTLTLSSQIHLVVSGPNPAVIDAQHGIITNDPRTIVLDHPHLDRESGSLQADQAVFDLDSENRVERILASGDVTAQMRMATAKTSGAAANENSVRSHQAVHAPASEIHARSDQAEFVLATKRDLLRTATMSGNVHVEETGTQPIEGSAGRVILDFAGRNQLQTVHAVDGARLSQKAMSGGNPSAKGTGGPQDFELTAPVIDFEVADGRILKRAVTSGAAQITIAQEELANGSGKILPLQRTVVTARVFEAHFETLSGQNHLASIHGAPNARIVNSSPGQLDRISTSESVNTVFLPQGGIDSFSQEGNVVYTDSQEPSKRTQAWANSARYTPSDQMLLLTGSPRVANGGMATTARTIRINRATGDALAEGDVKTTYSELKEQPNGALLSSSSPIHVTARSMTAHDNLGLALYTGNSRLWQDANVIEAPSIQFDRDRRFVTAQGTLAQPVRTILVQREKDRPDVGKTSGKEVENKSLIAETSPIFITAPNLSYADSERRVHYDGGVVAKATDFTASAKVADAFLLPRSQVSSNQPFARLNSGLGQLDHMIAEDDVVIQQPNRRAEGRRLVYTAADAKFVLTGGPPCIFDAEQGKITGVSLTFFRRDDRVLIEGEASTPVVTQTRVAR